ncbi:flagellin [Lacrimispora sp. JR3]|uniref:flagellin N-terminal helical domain-containing protein n=1 Tax=Lacrimispora sinapis TaxID=3111456 RepID=UPI00374A20EC
MRIQHNIAALNSYKNLTNNNGTVSKNLEKLSSGYRINRAGDDAAGLAISEKMRAQITGLETATKNANDGISLVQTAEGALTEVHSMLNRMVELAQQSANGTYQDSVDRENLQKEMKSLTTEIDRISTGTNFNGIALLSGNLDGSAKATKTLADTDATALKTNEFSFDVVGAKEGTKVIIATAAAGAAKATATIGGADKNEVTITISGKKGDEITQSDINKALEDARKGSSKADFEALGDLKVKLSEKVVFADDSVANAGVTSDATVKGAGKALTLQIGESSESHNKLDVNISAMSTKGLGLTGISVATQDSAADAVQVIKNAINTVSDTRGDLGALQNRLEHTINNLSVTTENMTAAESRIRDVDMAKEMMSYTKNNILVQASQAMLAQANQVPQGVLQLLK